MLELKERKIEACREECEAERRERVRERAYDREEQAHIRTEDGKRKPCSMASDESSTSEDVAGSDTSTTPAPWNTK
ncbi:hypothetical protein L917_05026 [Phytophthora nicotianae]|uniref:Uncharacterized protein n=1 Tax=Phytophthora nicotianae TaxID=4792 RepID=W2LK31_PHYNI|nr:hypothetical protein L917_05026 [Phytophthora nicotianae]